ncbi:MAG: ABC transporter substrate-binding protein [Thermoprotei archaeon]
MNTKYIVGIVVALIIGILIGYLPNTLQAPVVPATSIITTTIIETSATTYITTVVKTSVAIYTTTAVVTSSITTSVEWPRELVDALSREIVFEAPPERVVSTAPSITEILFMLGVGNRVIGVDDYSNYPPEVIDLVEQGKIARVGGPWSLDIEKIVSLNPDVVFMCKGILQQEKDYRAKLEEAGIKTFFLRCNAARDHYDIFYDIRLVGQVFDIRDRAENLINSIQDKISSVTNKLVNASKPRVLLLLGPPSWGLWSVGGDTFLGWLISSAGGDNIASTYSGWPQLSYEYILARDPEVIIITAMNIDPDSIRSELEQTPLVNTSAWRNGRVYLVVGEANDILNRPSPRIGLALEILASIIHPEVFGEIERPDVIKLV